jgi:hypothetical protein
MKHVYASRAQMNHLLCGRTTNQDPVSFKSQICEYACEVTFQMQRLSDSRLGDRISAKPTSRATRVLGLVLSLMGLVWIVRITFCTITDEANG